MIALGPFVLSAERFSAWIGIFVFLMTVALLTRRHGPLADRRATRAVVLGVVAARLAFVLANLPVFLSDPLSVLYIWQGGYLSLAGVAVAALLLALDLRRLPGQAAPMLVAALLAGAAWNTARLLSPDPAASQLPAGAFAALDGSPAGFVPGQPVVVNLWASWCPPCRREMPMMTEVAASETGVQMVFLNQGEGEAVIRRFLTRDGLPDRGMWLDPGQAMQAEFGIPGLPATLFFDAAGQLHHLHVGEISRAALLSRMGQIQDKAP
ncbi:redoxin family protein [Frigidibacter albus]|uniref:Redoxin family protein n=1 Tax=Frigidibacter albus TaxID=1465486 RepID=A0A6L8VFT0_9RHOB|nr:TlpA disulfide reductase family protein [Frigidibacter albus]MZQ88541.1 redoxin family protein [Frigidibacter albus]NBE30650.1 redoxin family protein [Frigidibacter albus]GGH48975.1 thiol:disulfide interchange protein [Frigidibacter albus]